MGSLSFGSGQSAIGLDIGIEHVRVAQVKASGSGYTVSAYGQVDVPMGAVADGEIVDAAAVSSAIKELWRRTNVRGKEVATAVSNQRVIVRLIDLPFMERAELQSAIQYQAQDYIPMAVEDSILDFQIIGDYMTPSDEHMMEVLLVAAHREMIGNAVSAVEGAGLKLNEIDVASFAIVRALMGDGQVLPDDEGQATAVVHISAGLTNIAVVERGIPRFNRISSLAGSTFTQAVANALNVGFEDAEQLKIMVGLPDVETGEGDQIPPGMTVEQAQLVHQSLEREVNKFIAEIRRSLDYYLTQTSQVRNIQRILLTGSGAQLRNFSAYLEKGLQAQVLLGDPLERVNVAHSAQAAVSADRLGCVTAIGLAMGGLRS